MDVTDCIQQLPIELRYHIIDMMSEGQYCDQALAFMPAGYVTSRMERAYKPKDGIIHVKLSFSSTHTSEKISAFTTFLTRMDRDTQWRPSFTSSLHIPNLTVYVEQIPERRPEVILELIPSTLEAVNILKNKCINDSIFQLFNYRNIEGVVVTADEKEFITTTNLLKINHHLVTLDKTPKYVNEYQLAGEIAPKLSKLVPRDLINMIEGLSVQYIEHEGNNLLHMLLDQGCADLLEVIFYSGWWDRLKPCVSNMDKYKGYAASGLIYKLICKNVDIFMKYAYLDDLNRSLTPLCKACLCGDFTGVLKLFKKDDKCLFFACARGHLSIVKFLLNRGLDPTVVNAFGEDCLIIATKYGHYHVVELLRKRKVFDLTAVDKFGYTAMDYVGAIGDCKLLNLFPEITGRVLTVACKYNRVEFILKSMNHMNLNIEDRDGCLPLMHAVENGNVELIELLITEINKCNYQHRTCLHTVAKTGSLEVCKLLLPTTTESILNTQDFYSGDDQYRVVRGRDHGRRAWHFVEVKRALMKQFHAKLKHAGDVDVKQFGDIMSSAFGLAPTQEILDGFKKQRREIAARGILDMTPLNMAAYYDNSEVFEALLEAGADPTIPDNNGYYPAHFAAMRGNINIIRKLHETSDVALEVYNNEGNTPLDMAEINKNKEVVNYITFERYQAYPIEINGYLQQVRKKLGLPNLTTLRNEGYDVRQHLISTLRDLQIDINGTLHSLKSSPIRQPSDAGKR